MEYRRQVQAVFQDPYEVYNPFYRVKHIFDLVIRNFKLARNKRKGARHDRGRAQGGGPARRRGVGEVSRTSSSGGQRQRMMVARAYMLKPRMIVADEPVSMVDASLRP